MSKLIKSFYNLYKYTPNVLQKNNCKKWHRNLHQSSKLFGYEGDGKTTVTFLDTEMSDMVVIKSFRDDGFVLNNNVFVHGSILLFPNMIFCVMDFF